MSALLLRNARACSAIAMPPAAARLLALSLALWAAPALLLFAASAAAQEPQPSVRPERPERFAGDYRIDGWESLEKQEIRHVFRLQKEGRFLLGADWPGHEHAKFMGTWSLSGERIVLQGEGEVWTNQGGWRIPFQRSYTVEEREGTIRLTPVPEKNRYGLLGWPNSFVLVSPAAQEPQRQ